MSAATPTPYAPKQTPRKVVLLTLAVGVVLPIALFGAILVLSPLTKPEMLGHVLKALGANYDAWSPTAQHGAYAVAAALLGFMLLNFGAIISGTTVWWEMRVSSRMQSRIGYNRVGAGGFFQWIADAVKLLLKEDLIPADADQLMFRAAPYFVFAGFGLIFVALPFGEGVIAADLNVGIFYVVAVTALVAFVIFFVSQLAESNRPPFDLPEAESELVAGYLSEYSAFRYAIFFLVEFGNVWIMSAIAVTLFFGGWQVPGVTADMYEAARGAGALPAPAWWGLQVASMVVFAVKTMLVMNLVIWIRWTFPRIRVDQMMNLCWKYLVPGAFATFVATLLWQILVASVPAAATVSGVTLSVLAVLALVQMLRQARQAVEAGGDRVDLSNW